MKNLSNEFASKFRVISNRLKCPYCGSSPEKVIILIDVLPAGKRSEKQKPLSSKQDLKICPNCGGATFSF